MPSNSRARKHDEARLARRRAQSSSDSGSETNKLNKQYNTKLASSAKGKKGLSLDNKHNMKNSTGTFDIAHGRVDFESDSGDDAHLAPYGSRGSHTSNRNTIPLDNHVDHAGDYTKGSSDRTHLETEIYSERDRTPTTNPVESLSARFLGEKEQK